MIQCSFCKRDFEPKKPRGRFCSDKCRVYFFRANEEVGGFIYCLKNPLKGNEIFYIGQTRFSLKARLTAHKHDRLKESEKGHILKAIIDSGANPIIEPLETVSGHSLSELRILLNEKEKFWIREFVKKGNELSNVTLKVERTEPIGVRFEPKILDMLSKKGLAHTKQQVLKYLEDFYEKEQNKLKSYQSQNKPNTATPTQKAPTVSKKEEVPDIVAENKHPLWKENDPSENTFSFLRKYDCMNYEELAEKLKNQ